LADYNSAKGDHTSKIFEVLKILRADCKESC